ncbi:helix-turn-helix domain-containing protein [Alistipes shahii]|jgi:transcriptional regulator with XRE-family HTH domain|uniref:helix-turn-helix domain-containing protein n=1 Tax=Alistipes shahii TaxID=328814 RepID=UPI003AF09FB9
MYSIDLKIFRRANKMTQQELADYLGVGQGFISQMEKNGRRVPEKYISKILSDKSKDSSMVQIIDSDNSNNEVTMSREVFDKMSQLIDTVCSQQGTIADQQKLITEQQQTIGRLSTSVESGAGVRAEGDAGCAAAK